MPSTVSVSTHASAAQASSAQPAPILFANRGSDIAGQHYDAVLVGGGIMSATLGTFLSLLEPTWRILIVERLDEVARESSNPWNNAGTGHAALCELNYTPERPDGTIETTKAATINRNFEVSRTLWAALTRRGLIPDPSRFLSVTPHMTLVRGAKDVDYLKRRYEAIREVPGFTSMEFSTDRDTIASWAPLLVAGRRDEPIAATRVAEGTDINFGALTRELIDILRHRGTELRTNHEVTKLHRRGGKWQVQIKDRRWNASRRPAKITADFVFVGAGGYALPLLQRSGIKEIRGYGGFPISGKFLRTTNPDIVAKHQAKVYGKASVGSPPMSVPHLDTRVVDGKEALLFGPYAGFSPRYLKTGSLWDLVRSLRLGNIISMVGAGWHNMDLTRYLIGQLIARDETQFRALLDFYPEAKPGDWEWITAGQRVQVIKRDKGKGGKLEFGTELVTSSDGSIAGLLGASPGASTAAATMVRLLKTCFPDRIDSWRSDLEELVPGAFDSVG
ncbi:malate dehydrogenase (quinone) [Micrococcales bacterium KH10]|nr:malate dehydrogenase (quinone) [Micrococcales bacterium KH10]